MAFKLGNFAVQEVLYGIAEDFSGNILYTLDQLSSAQIEISSDPTEITDKSGNLIKQIYRSKNGTLTATSALLSPNVMNAGSGSEIQTATTAKAIKMPKVDIVKAGGSIVLDSTTDADSIKVIGLYGNGANGPALTKDTAPVVDETFGYDSSTYTVTVPDAADDAPIQYLVKSEREVKEGIKMVNNANEFPKTVHLTLYVALADPCEDSPRAAYVYIPSFQADPSTTISFDSESTEVDFTGSLQVDYCGCEKQLYTIYFPKEDAVITTACD